MDAGRSAARVSDQFNVGVRPREFCFSRALRRTPPPQFQLLIPVAPGSSTPHRPPQDIANPAAPLQNQIVLQVRPSTHRHQLPMPEPSAIIESTASLETRHPVNAPDGSAAPSQKSYHRTMLALSLAVIVLAVVLSVRRDQRVEFGWLQGWPIPELCQSKALFGWDCPGCGLTRSFIHLAHGDIRASYEIHRLGWLLALLVVLQVPYRLWALRFPGGSPLGARIPWVGTWLIVLLLMANWIARIVQQLS